MANNDNKLITVAGLTQFFNKLKTYLSDVCYTKTETNAAFAAKAGSGSQDFSVKKLVLNTSPNKYASFSRENAGSARQVKILDDSGATTTIPLDGGIVYTTNVFRHEDKAEGRIVPVGASSISFLTSNEVAVFSTPGESVTFEADDDDLVTDSSILTGTILYIMPSDYEIDDCAPGFYIVSSSTGGVTRLVFLCAPNNYTVYYNATTGSLCYWSTSRFYDITTSSGGSIIINNDDYELATDTDINGIFNS